MQKTLSKVWLSLGANLGHPETQLGKARELIALGGTKILRASSLYRTKPWGKTDQPDFLNQVLEVETDSSPSDLLERLIEIETSLGRVRSEKWGPRLIDIDILMYGEQVLDLPGLKIPHPLFHLRDFCLDPLCELEPDLLHPIYRLSMKELREALNNREES